MTNLAQHAERKPVPGSTIDDLSLNLVREHVAIAVEHRDYDGPKEPLDYLLHHSAVIQQGHEIIPTLAGVLAFGRKPERWLGASGVDIAQFRGQHAHSTDIIFSKQIRGDLARQIDQMVDLLWARSDHSSRLEGADRIEEHAYPLVVIRELTVNAIAHRDWTYAGSRIRIQMFSDRIEWISPGGLPPGVTVSNIRHEQFSRNPALAQILYQAGKVESFGMGIDTVEDTLRAWGCKPLEMVDSSRALTVTVYAKPLGRGTPTVTPAPAHERRQTILQLVDQRGSLSISDIEHSIDASRRTIQNDLRALVEERLLKVTGATNNRRYSRT